MKHVILDSAELDLAVGLIDEFVALCDVPDGLVPAKVDSSPFVKVFDNVLEVVLDLDELLALYVVDGLAEWLQTSA